MEAPVRSRLFRWAVTGFIALTRVVTRFGSGPPFRMPSRPSSGVRLTRDDSRGYPVVTIEPATGPRPDAALGVYFHGGSYEHEISPFHWRLLTDVVERSGARILVSIYPLSGVQSAARTVPQAAQLIDDAIEVVGPEQVVVAGDSAGGGLACAALLYRRGRPQPRHAMLLAPWLDITMTHPDQPSIQPHDPVLRIDDLVRQGRAYAGELEARDPMVSPLFGPLEALPPLTVVTGGDDLLVVDARRLRDAVLEAGGRLEYREEPGMTHVFSMGPAFLPQTRRVRDRLVRLLAE